MLLSIFFFILYLGLFMFIPAFCVLIGSFFDRGTRIEGNFRNDLPSTFGFLFGILINLYIAKLYIYGIIP